jgi:hypothetical protein
MKIILEKNQNIFFTSDSHAFHRNICSATSEWPEGRGTRKFHLLILDLITKVILNMIIIKIREINCRFFQKKSGAFA